MTSMLSRYIADPPIVMYFNLKLALFEADNRRATRFCVGSLVWDQYVALLQARRRPWYTVLDVWARPVFAEYDGRPIYVDCLLRPDEIIVE